MDTQTAELKKLNELLREKVAELEHTEAALRESEERYMLAVQGSRDGLWDWNIVTDEVYFSPRFKEILGYQDHEMANQFSEFESRLHADDRESVLAAIQTHLQQQGPYDIEYRLRTQQGSYLWLRAKGQAIWNDRSEPTRMAGSISDITARKQTELQLKTSLKELADVKFALDRSSIVAITDHQGRITHVNDQFCEISGYDRGELLGKNHRLINSGHHPAEFFREMWQIMGSGQVWQGEIKNRAKNGSFYWVDTTIVPILDESKMPSQYVAIRNDITDRKQAEAELLRANEQLEAKVIERTHELEQRAQELERSNEELGKFAYVASHDLQEPLRTISSYTELLVEEYGDRLDGEAEEYVDFIVDGASRMQQLIKDLLAFSRVGTKGKAFAPVDCDDVVQKVLGSLKLAIQESEAQVTVDALPIINADVSQIYQLVQNLMSNALKFRGQAPPRVHLSAVLKDDWEFCVRDNGIGIDAEYFDQIFEIFQRLHSRRHYDGTGIGLAICRKIVERHGGKMWVEATPGEGSAFYFTIPSVLADTPADTPAKHT